MVTERKDIFITFVSVMYKKNHILFPMKHSLSFPLLLLALAAPLSAAAQTQPDTSLVQYVDPLIGSGDHGHVFVGASVPGGMVMAGPTQSGTGWDWCSGYHHSGTEIIGFGQMHLNGTGCSDLGDISLMPSLGPVELSRQGLASAFSHETEIARPGYYAVRLERDAVRAEVTATQRVALYRFTFPRGSNNARITVDLENAVGDKRRQSRIFQVDEFTLCGFRFSHGWVSDQRVWFVIQFNRPIHNFLANGPDDPYAQATFEVGPGDKVMVKVALSPTGETGAFLNMRTEMPGWDFNAVRNQATQMWNDELGRVKVQMGSRSEMRTFYTALYHALMAPQLWNDVTGDYRGADGQYHYYATWNNLTTWSLWDTYRALHPLYTLVMRDHMTDMVNTLLSIAREQGELPVWHLTSGDTYCMVGCPAVPVLADMVLKGLVPEAQQQEAYQAMLMSLRRPTRGLPWMWSHGYVPAGVGQGEHVAKTLEYSLAFGAAQQVAARLGLTADSAALEVGARGYRNLWDATRQFMLPKDKEGNFVALADFNPNHQIDGYTEGNPWQYAWLVPHDVQGLVDLYPGTASFIAHLDGLFEASSELNADANPDISGLIGQYAHGNEPSHHILYLYSYVGQPWKTARRVHQVMRTLYSDRPDGVCGNEDAGQMSAWYILSALGLYQVEPAGGRFVIGSPSVSEATLRISDDTSFRIVARGLSDENIYVQSVKLNGKKWTSPFLPYDKIVAGGTLEFQMGNKETNFAK